MSSIICPSCGVLTSFNPLWIQKRGINDERSSSDSIIYVKATVELIEEYSSGITQYGILVCQSCDERIVVEKKQYARKGDWQVVYPIMHKVASQEIPEPIKSEYEEASLCFAISAYRACASMCQRTLESLCQNKNVSRLNQLLSDGIISKALYDRATEIRLWAGVTKHKPLV